MAGRPHQRINEVARSILLEVDKRQYVCYYMFMIKEPQNPTSLKTGLRKFLSDRGTQKIIRKGHENPNAFSKAETRMIGFKDVAIDLGIFVLSVAIGVGSVTAFNSRKEAAHAPSTLEDYRKDPKSKVNSGLEEYTIKENDTAWSISGNRSPKGADIRILMDQLSEQYQVNNHTSNDSDGHFEIGKVLVVPRLPSDSTEE